MVATIINDSKDRLSAAENGLKEKAYSDSIYNSYTSMIVGAKALLLSADVKCNTHSGIIDDFDTNYVENGNWFYKFSKMNLLKILLLNT